MKAFITAIAVVFLFAAGSAAAGMGEGHGEYSGCNKSKWEDT